MAYVGTRPAPLTTHEVTRRDLYAGAIAGQIAGLIMAAVMIAVYPLFLGKSFYYPVQVIGSIFFGDAALDGFRWGPFLTGLVVHQLGPSLFWGVVCGAVAGALGLRGGSGFVALAICTGIFSQLLDVNLLMPPVMKALHGHNIWAREVPAFWSWAAHIVYGLGLLCMPRVWTWLETRRR